MRLLKRFLTDLGSKYEPGKVVSINNKRFTSSIKPPVDVPNLVYTGTYLGQNRERFEPSSILLQLLGDEPNTHKVYMDRETAWLFVVGKNVFEENIIKSVGLRLGGYVLVMYEDFCIGYGRYETSHNRRIIRNLYDIGDFLRREQE